MAGTRYARYIALAIVTIAVIFFITSSSSAPEVSGSTIEGYKQSFKGIQEKFRGTHTPISSGGDATTRPGENEEEAATTKDKSPANPPKEPGTTPNYQNTLGPPKASGPRMNATFVTLARNSDLWEISKSIRTIEDRFNFKHNYDWVFLNDKPFDADFKKITTALISGNARYGLIPEAHWSFPEWIDKDKAAQVRKTMAQKKVIYGDSISYRHMCRYESGFFHQHPLMKEYAWYWRVEPSIELFCNIEYDPFEYMANNSMKYSFVISLPEYKETIETLWDSTKKFMKKHPEHVAKDNSMEFVSDDGGETYNRCHFWSNFEIGSLEWLRGPAYSEFFNSLDRDGGFFYERWGDAPVHSIGAAITLPKDQIHFFNDIAYYHVPFTHCPLEEKIRLDNKCHCNPKASFDWNGYSCTKRYYEMHGMERPPGYDKKKDGKKHS